MLIQTLIDVPVLGVKEGRIGGRIRSWLIDGAQKRIAAFLFTTDHWYDGIGAIAMEQIQGIGDGAVIVHSLENLETIGRNDALRSLAAQKIEGIHAPVFSPTGKSYGKVADIELGDMGAIRFLILEDGSRISHSRILVLGQVVLIGEGNGQDTALRAANQEGQIVVPSSVGNPIIIRTQNS